MWCLFSVDSADLGGACAFGAYNFKTFEAKWLHELDYVGASCVKSFIKWGEGYAALCQFSSRINQLLLLNSDFSIEQIVASPGISFASHLASLEDRLVCISSEGLQFVHRGLCGSVSLESTEYSGGICFGVSATLNRLVTLSRDDTSFFLYDALSNVEITRLPDEVSAPTAVLASGDDFLIADANVPGIYSVQERRWVILLERGFPRAVTFSNGVFYVARNAWRRFSRRSNFQRGNWNKAPAWVGHGYAEAFSCDVALYDESFTKLGTHGFSHLANEVSGFVPLVTSEFVGQPDAAHRRAVLYRENVDRTITNYRRRLEKSG